MDSEPNAPMELAQHKAIEAVIDEVLEGRVEQAIRKTVMAFGISAFSLSFDCSAKCSSATKAVPNSWTHFSSLSNISRLPAVLVEAGRSVL